MKTALLAALLLLVPALAQAEPAGLETWQKRHPEASRELGDWVRAHPAAAERFFTWDGEHPERSKIFVTWTIAHPGLGIGAFVVEHRGWPVFDEIAERHRPAAEGFLAWTRRHPRAAEALMRHTGGLAWAGHHLYADAWHLEHPNR
jgi:hypothetical protein